MNIVYTNQNTPLHNGQHKDIEKAIYLNMILSMLLGNEADQSMYRRILELSLTDTYLLCAMSGREIISTTEERRGTCTID